MNKINTDYMIDSFNKVSSSYKDATINVGLWHSEEDLILQYTNSKADLILDMGCGAGRCAYGMEELGYYNINAIDFSPLMIKSAKEVNPQTIINFEVGDCTDIIYEGERYDFAFFSFNGLMMIPKRDNRLKALKELRRVLKKDKYLIFTTHDRDNGNENYRRLWLQEKHEWDSGFADPRLHDFGDVITHDDDNDIEYFIHIPSQEEVMRLIKESGFDLVDTFIRSSRYRENKEVYDFSDNCRFWVVKK